MRHFFTCFVNMPEEQKKSAIKVQENAPNSHNCAIPGSTGRREVGGAGLTTRCPCLSPSREERSGRTSRKEGMAVEEGMERGRQLPDN